MPKLNSVKEMLREFRDNRERIKELDSLVKTSQPELIAVMQNVDPDNKGIVFDEDDTSRGAAFVQQNNPTEIWDEESIIEYLRKDKARWMSCSSRVLDVRKWEAEIANGNISPRIAKKFKTETATPKPFIRFGKAK